MHESLRIARLKFHGLANERHGASRGRAEAAHRSAHPPRRGEARPRPAGRGRRTLLDVGTAQGCLPVEIARAHPHLAGGGFDLPPVRPLFEDYVSEHGLADRLRFFPGDFANDALPTADVIVLGRILHNWDLPTKQQLLRKAHDALPGGGALIVYERLIDDERRTSASALLASLNMLIMTAGGFDFTAADCLGWMREAGFRDLRLAPLAGEFSMITGLK
jgi:hypothetical protein